jgi:WD40 repeat protein
MALAPGERDVLTEDGMAICHWDLFKQKRTVLHERKVELVAYRNSNIHLLTGGKRTVLGINESERRSTLLQLKVPSGRRVGKALHHDALVLVVSSTPDGQYMISGDNRGQVIFWDLAHQRKEKEFAHPSRVRSLAISADGALLVCGCDDGQVWLWDTGAAHKPWQHFQAHAAAGESISAVALSPDGRSVFSASLGDKTCKIWALPSGEWKHTIKLEENLASLTCVCLSANGRIAVSGHEDGVVALWDLGARRRVDHYKKHNGAVSCVTVSADGRLALSAGKTDGRIWVYRLPGDLAQN